MRPVRLVGAIRRLAGYYDLTLNFQIFEPITASDLPGAIDRGRPSLLKVQRSAEWPVGYENWAILDGIANIKPSTEQGLKTAEKLAEESVSFKKGDEAL